MAYAQVVVEIASAQVDRVFDYVIPEELRDRICPGMRVRVPFGLKELEGYVMAITESSDVPAGRLRPIGRLLDDDPAILPPLMELARWMVSQYHCLWVEALRLMIPAQMRGQRVKEKTARAARLVLSGPDALSLAQLWQKRAPQQALALRSLVEAGGEGVCASLPGPASVWRALEKKGVVTLFEQRIYRTPARLATPECPVTLTGEQRAALDKLIPALQTGGGRFLLHGVTGSGKTEIYLACARQALAMGKGVIILVPEIALTPQMVARFTGAFGALAAVLHSRLSAGERLDEWQRIRQGEARVVIGARSAVFAPLMSPGLIVVDEEHEPSYLSEHRPCYHAIEVADQRCRREGAVLLLGSATPSLEHYRQAQAGGLTLLRLSRRAIATGGMPRVELVDMRRELAAGNRSVISGSLYDALCQCLARGEQALLFLNRRGYASFVSCRACGYVERCELCDLSMTYHKGRDELICHYCGSTRPVPEICPSCGSRSIRYFGGGTQKVQEEMERLFPEVKTLRMDADTTSGKEGHLKIYEAFRDHQAQVLIGTQMIAKGLDFPMVTVVGVVAADQTLFLPDYRAAERTFQLVAQVAGRAGRARRPGRVIVQCYTPEHYALKAAANHDYEGFYRQEIEIRRADGFPPFTRFLRLVFSHEDEDACQKDMQEALSQMRAACAQHIEWGSSIVMLEGTPAPLTRIRALYRYQLLMKIYPEPYGRQIEEALAEMARRSAPYGSQVAMEINPQSMV